MISLTAETLLGTILTRVGLPALKPLSWALTSSLFAYALVACLVVNDTVKVALIRWRVPSAVA
jgi:hypothetical protein